MSVVMERDYVFNTLPQKKRWKAKAQVLFKPLNGPLASDFYRSMGDTSSIVLNRTIEESEVYSNETPRKDLAVLSVNKAEPALTIAFRQMTDVLQSLVFMSDPAKRNQVAVVDHVVDFADVSKGDIVRLDHQEINAIEVVAAGQGGIQYLIGIHFQIDASGGSLEILAHPAGAVKGSFKVTYDADAIVDREEYGLMDSVDPRFSVLVRQNNLWGPSHEYEFWNGQARVDGDVPLSQDGDDFGEGTVKVRLFADPLRSSKFRYGRVRTVAAVT